MVDSSSHLTNLEFLIFNRSGLCLMHADLQEGAILPCSGQMPVKLSDKTRIANTYWKQLKKTAMEDSYQQEEWFADLNKVEKKLLDDLRSA